MLAGALLERGYVVRATTRDAARRSEIEAAGAQCVVADPDQIGSLVAALDQVSVLVLLLGSARGAPERLAELHGPRLDNLLTWVRDTAVHGVVYEARGSADAKLLRAGAESVRAFGARCRTPTGLLEADPTRPEKWLRRAVVAVEAVLER